MTIFMFILCAVILLTAIGLVYWHGRSSKVLDNTEIEHRFLVSKTYREHLLKKFRRIKPQYIKQGYLCEENGVVTRVRINTTGYYTNAFLTIKGKKVNGVCPEFEYPITMVDAVQMMELCTKTIEKRRYKYGRWEVDFFEGEHEGLIIAEIELESKDEEYDKPIWLGDEVTNDHSYSNNNLATKGKS